MFTKTLVSPVIILTVLMSFGVAEAKHAGLLNRLVQSGIVGMLKLKHAATNHEVTLLSEAHHNPYDPVVQQHEAQQYDVVRSYVVAQEQNSSQKPLHVLVEQPFEALGQPAKGVSPARSIAQLQNDPQFDKARFENAEKRIYAGGGYLAFNKDLSYFDTVKRIAVGGVEYVLDTLQLQDIVRERLQFKTQIAEKKNLFNPSQTSWVERVMQESDDADQALELTIERLGHDTTSNVLDVARTAQEKLVADYPIAESYVHEDQQTVRPSLSHMTTAMIDPLYELYLYSRIAEHQSSNHLVIAGTTHTALLKMMLQKNNYSIVGTAGSNRPGMQRILEPDSLKKALS